MSERELLGAILNELRAIRTACRCPHCGTALDVAVAPVPSPGWVYLAHSAQHSVLKIGYSKSPNDRPPNIFYKHKIHVDLVAAIVGGRALERELHNKFAEHRRKGEWFRDVPEIRAYFAEHGQPWSDE